MLALLGPSGSGKTTALRLIAGFERRTAAASVVDGEDVTALPPERRRFGMVFQHYALFPHLDVGENVAFGLEAAASRRRGACAARVAEALALVDLPGYEAPRGSARSRAASSSGWRSPAPSRPSRGCCCSTSRSRTSIPPCASAPAASCAGDPAGRHHHRARHPRAGGGLPSRRPRGRAQRRRLQQVGTPEELYDSRPPASWPDFVGRASACPADAVAARRRRREGSGSTAVAPWRRPEPAAAEPGSRSSSSSGPSRCALVRRARAARWPARWSSGASPARRTFFARARRGRARWRCIGAAPEPRRRRRRGVAPAAAGPRRPYLFAASLAMTADRRRRALLGAARAAPGVARGLSADAGPGATRCAGRAAGRLEHVRTFLARARPSGGRSGGASGSRSRRRCSAALIGVPLAFLFARASSPAGGSWARVVALPAVLPPLVGVHRVPLPLRRERLRRARWSRRCSGLDEPPWRLEGAGAILLVHAYSMYVYFYLFVRAGLAWLDASL